jgi:predicted RNA-binding protein YlqC (UPF0109 family)
MKELVAYMAKALVDEPDQVTVTETTEGRTVRLDLEVRPEDIGRIIGRGGRVINAMRTLVQMCAARQDLRAELEIVE